MTQRVKSDIGTARTVWQVQKIASLRFDAAFKTRNRELLCHVTIYTYIYIYIYVYIYTNDISCVRVSWLNTFNYI